MNRDEYLRGLFEGQKEHIDRRFDSLEKSLEKCNECHTEVEKELAGEISQLKNNKKKQMVVTAVFGLIGGAAMVALNFITGGAIFNVIPGP